MNEFYFVFSNLLADRVGVITKVNEVKALLDVKNKD